MFIGLENINPDSLKGAQKGQNQIDEYRTMLQAWHRVGTLTYAGYILGFPGDTPASIERDIGIIQRELPIDILEFFILTPLPGSADHKTLHLAGVEMERDMNRYDLAHVTTRHPKMRDEELLGIYRKAWDLYYSPAHVETVMRRAKGWGYDPHNMMWKLLSFHAPPLLEKVHPLEGGIFRRKYRRDRRPTCDSSAPSCSIRASPGRSFPSTRASPHVLALPAHAAPRPARPRPYSDLAMTPAKLGDVCALELFSATQGGRKAAERERRRQAAAVTR